MSVKCQKILIRRSVTWHNLRRPSLIWPSVTPHSFPFICCRLEEDRRVEWLEEKHKLQEREAELQEKYSQAKQRMQKAALAQKKVVNFILFFLCELVQSLKVIHFDLNSLRLFFFFLFVFREGHLARCWLFCVCYGICLRSRNKVSLPI